LAGSCECGDEPSGSGDTELVSYSGTVHQIFIDFKKAYNSVRREVLYSILIMFGIPRKLSWANSDVFK
jgi:hypothetical protein